MNFDINNLETDLEDNLTNEKFNNKNNNENNVKTIVIDTKQQTNETKESDLNNDSPKKKVFRKYSSRRKKDFSFFSDALTE